MYVAVKGGERAIENAHKLLAEKRRGDAAIPDIAVEQIAEQLSIGAARVMAEGSLYDPDLAALAIKQARGDFIEAIFLVRAYRTTLPRFGYSLPLDTGAMTIERRISAVFKDIPGGQILGPTFDYTHRLIDFTLAANNEPPRAEAGPEPLDEEIPRVLDLLQKDDLIEASTDGASNSSTIGDLTREPLEFPAGRDLRLQNLARGDEGFLLALAYSTQRGYGRNHPFAGEIRMGDVQVEFVPEELGFAIVIAEITVTECESINQFKGSKEVAPMFTRGYGLVFGHSERKAISMALVDRALRAQEFEEAIEGPAQDEEFVMEHSDNVQATGFVEHLKLPHYVDFQAELDLLRIMRADQKMSEHREIEAAE